jgi:hypothetical protein
VEKLKPVSGKVNISNNVALKDVEPMKLPDAVNKQKGLRFLFNFVSKYEPGVGHVELQGEVLYFEKSEKIKQILDDWKKSKKVEGKVMESVMNTILAKCNIQALILSRDINLPPPVQLPKVARGNANTKKAAKK